MALLRGISCGLRINPQYSPVETDLYNPCVPGSRLGVTADELNDLPAGIDGLHFHVLCESRPHHLKLALEAVEKHFGQYLDRIGWLNMGGGHLMTHAEYNCDELIALLHGYGMPSLRDEPIEITGLRVGVVGLGVSGRMIADALSFMGAEISYYSRSRKPEAEQAGMTYKPLDQLLSESEVVFTCLNKNCLLYTSPSPRDS